MNSTKVQAAGWRVGCLEVAHIVSHRILVVGHGHDRPSAIIGRRPKGPAVDVTGALLAEHSIGRA